MALTKKELTQDKQNWWYWQERQAAIQTEITDKSIAETEKQLARYYLAAQKNVINQFERTYEKLLNTVADGKEPTPADLYKLDTYWKMEAEVSKELDKLGNKQAALLSKNFVNEWEHIYKGVALKDGLFFNKINTDLAKQMINQIWYADGKTWSDRIWTNTNLLKEELNEHLINCVLTGKKTTELKKILQERFGVSYSRADTVVRTEMAHIQTQAAKQRYADEGVRYVEILADKDERRCDRCGELHQKRYPVFGNVPIPAHPNCRCCILPVVE